MTIFVVFKVADPEKMDRAMRQAYSNDHLRLDGDEWLVSANGTAKEVSDSLQITPENVTGAAIVFSMANYYGRAATDVWDWIKVKSEQVSG